MNRSNWNFSRNSMLPNGNTTGRRYGDKQMKFVVSPSRILRALGTYITVPFGADCRSIFGLRGRPRPEQSHLLPDACSPNGNDNKRQRQNQEGIRSWCEIRAPWKRGSMSLKRGSMSLKTKRGLKKGGSIEPLEPPLNTGLSTSESCHFLSVL